MYDRVCVVSAIRLVTLVRIDMLDFPFTGPVAVMFSALEPCLLITAACVPLLRPLLGYRYSPNGTAKCSTTDSPRHQDGREGLKRHNQDLFEKGLRPEPVHYDAVVASKTGDSTHSVEDLVNHQRDMESISVRKDWKVEGELSRPAK